MRLLEGGWGGGGWGEAGGMGKLLGCDICGPLSNRHLAMTDCHQHAFFENNSNEKYPTFQ